MQEDIMDWHCMPLTLTITNTPNKASPSTHGAESGVL